MTLKDWKKVGKDKWIIRNKAELEIYKATSGTYITDYKFEASNGRIDFGIKACDTKSQALKFAKQYMRTH